MLHVYTVPVKELMIRVEQPVVKTYTITHPDPSTCRMKNTTWKQNQICHRTYKIIRIFLFVNNSISTTDGVSLKEDRSVQTNMRKNWVNIGDKR